MKKGGNHLLIYPAAAVFAVLAVMQALENFRPQIAGFFLYALAAVSLTAACVSLYKDLKRGAIGHLFQIIKGTSLGSHFLEDYTFRTILTTVPTVLINVAYTIYNGVIGIMSQSSWFITMAVYYSLLGAMRYHAVSTGRKISRMEDPAMVRRKELSVIRTDGILLFLLDLALSGVILLTIAKGRAKVYSDIIAISIAAYTFYKITMAVINMVKVRKFADPAYDSEYRRGRCAGIHADPADDHAGFFSGKQQFRRGPDECRYRNGYLCADCTAWHPYDLLCFEEERSRIK